MSAIIKAYFCLLYYMDIDNLLIDLEVVGQLRGSDKLAVNTIPGSHNLYIHSGSYTQSMRRWYSGADRLSAIQYITELTEKCNRAATVIQEGQHTAMATSLKKALSNALTGINMLNTTYSDDSSIVAQLSLVTQKISVIVDRLDRVDRVDRIAPTSHSGPIPIPNTRTRNSNTTEDGMNSPLYSSPRD